MVTAVAPAAAVAPTAGGNSIIKALDDIKAMDAIDKAVATKMTALNLKDVPQDARSPLIDDTPRDGSKNYNAQGSPAVAGHIHAWVSPNKSDEMPSSKESSPDAGTSSLPSSKAPSPDSFHLNISASSDDNKENVNNSFSNASVGASPIAVVGKRLVGSKKSGVPPLGLAAASSSTAMTDLAFNASAKDWIKVVHGGKEVLLMLHKDVSDWELCETLIASLGITKEIVGLKSTGTLFTEDSTFKEHGDIIIPFSAVSSGRLLSAIKTMDYVPSFELVTADLESFLEKNNQDIWQDAVDGSVYTDDSSKGNESSGIHESMLYTDAFIELMSNSNEFDAIEKNALLQFGVDNADSNVLFRAAFRVAVYAENLSFYVKGLKDIASVLISGSGVSDEDSMLLMEEGAAKKSAKTIFGLSEFVITADELYECNDLNTGQYVALLHSIFSDDEDIERLFDLYQNPDFLVACETDTQRCSLLLRDLLHIGQKLPLINSVDSDDALLKWAIHTGVHNFAAANSGVPKEFFNIIYHMFSSGDEQILEACKTFVESEDAEVMENMIEREWSIYCKNNEIVPKSDAATAAEELELELKTTKYEPSDKDKFKEIPDVLETATNCLTELNDVTANEAAAILTSYAKGNQVVADIYETYMQDGDTDTFLSMLRVIAPTLLDYEEEDPNQLMRDAFEHFVEDESFRPVDLAALRLASVRKDKVLVSSLLNFKNDKDIDGLKTNLLTVAAKTIAEYAEE